MVEQEMWEMTYNQVMKKTKMCKKPCRMLKAKIKKVYQDKSRIDKASLHLVFVDPMTVVTEEHACGIFCLIVDLGDLNIHFVCIQILFISL